MPLSSLLSRSHRPLRQRPQDWAGMRVMLLPGLTRMLLLGQPWLLGLTRQQVTSRPPILPS